MQAFIDTSAACHASLQMTHKYVCGLFAGSHGFKDQNSPPSVDSDYKAVSFIQQVDVAAIIRQASHTHRGSRALVGLSTAA